MTKPHHSSTRFPSRSLALLAAIIAIPSLSIAQAPDQKPAERMPEVVVTGSNQDTNALPTYRPIQALFGFDQSILDTPRSVSIIPKRLLEDADVQKLDGFSALSSSTFTAAQFGEPGLPQIRGQDGEVFQNGIRRNGGNNGYGLPISFNPFESVDIVKGPPPSFLGPTQRVGGYVNLVTKQPYFDAFHGDIGASYGSWDDYRWHFDLGGPLTSDHKLAFRFSYEGQDAGSYYDFVRNKSQDIYLALAYKPYDNLRIDFNAEYFNARYSDNAGITRPTQELIDNGTYITGPANFPGFGALVSPTGTVKISRSNVNTAPMDASLATTYILQNKTELKVNDNLTIVNHTYFQSLWKNTQNENSFVEIIASNYTVEDRLEFHIGFDYPFLPSHNTPDAVKPDGKKTVELPDTQPEFNNGIVTGFDFRWNHVVGYSNFNFEADNTIDLTAPLSTRLFPRALEVGSLELAGKYNHALVSPGANYPNAKDFEGNVGLFGNNDTNGSDIYQYGYFIQQNTHITDKLTLLIGGRADLFAVTSTDPIPPKGFSPVSDSTTMLEGSGNASLSYKLFSWATPYLTYSYSQSYNPSLAGGVALVNNTIPTSDFHIASELYEIGSKFHFLDDKLIFTAAGFIQDRNAVAFPGGPNIKYHVKGIELDSTYQPNKNFYATANFTYMNAHLDNVGGVLQATREVADAFDNSRPDIIHGTGLGSPNFYNFPPKNYHVSGFPDISFGMQTGYTMDCGLGASLGLVVTSSYPLDLLQTVTIPVQYTLNAAVYYKKENWEVRVDVFNLTDQKNWSPTFGFFGGGYFGADDVYPDLPIHAQVSVRYKF